MADSLYVREGGNFRPTTTENLRIEHQLPVGNYTIKADIRGFYFEPIGGFDLPKLYGDTTKMADRVLQSFHSRPYSTGVLLSGTKGTGKSLLAKKISIDAAKAGVATFVVNTPLCGEEFNTLIQGIDQPAVVMFDEFEKVYNRERQAQLLTLLDGMYQTKKLFVLTVNDMWSVDEHMINRPGRLFYHLKFSGLSEAEIEGYCQDNLVDVSKLESVKRCASLFSAFSFDLLKALVEEMNRFGESAGATLKWLNVDPASGTRKQMYDVKLFTPEGVELDVHHPNTWHGMPFTNDGRDAPVLTLNAYMRKDQFEARKMRIPRSIESMFDSDGELDQRFVFDVTQFQPTESRGGSQVFRNKDGFTLTFTPQVSYTRNYGAF